MTPFWDGRGHVHAFSLNRINTMRKEFVYIFVLQHTPNNVAYRKLNHNTSHRLATIMASLTNIPVLYIGISAVSVIMQIHYYLLYHLPYSNTDTDNPFSVYEFIL